MFGPVALVDVWMMMFDSRHPIDLKAYFEAHVDLVLNGLLAKQDEPRASAPVSEAGSKSN